MFSNILNSKKSETKIEIHENESFLFFTFNEFKTERHNRTEADRRFACKLCPMKFFNSTNLKSHVNKHFGVKSK